MSHSILRGSSSLLVGALTVLSACTETNPIAPAKSPATAQLGVGGNAPNAKACQKNGWQTLTTSTGASFPSEQACVAYAAQGGVLNRKQSQTVSFTSASPSFGLKGAPTYAPTATATSGLAVAIALDATSTGCSLANGAVTFTAAGTCVINATQAGSVSWEPATPKQQSITVYDCVNTEALLRYTAAAGGNYDLCAGGTRIVLTAGELVVATTLSLTALGGVNGVIDANAASRVMTVTATGSLTLRDVTLTGGRVADIGGGIRVEGGQVVLNGNSAIDSNVAQAAGGVLIFGGSITLNDASTISNNTATEVDTPGGGTGIGGGIYLFAGSLTMNGTSTIRKNIADGSANEGGGVYMSDATLTMNGSSSILENSAGSETSEVEGVGGGVHTQVSTLILNESATITRNFAVLGGGIFRGGWDVGTVIGVTAANVTGNMLDNCGGSVPGCVN